MPELPEIETIRLGLKKHLVGHKILDVDLRVPKIFQGDKKNIIGAKIESIERIGKGLIINLSNNYSIAFHIKLTGQIIYRGSDTKKVSVSNTRVGELPSKFTHVIFSLDPSTGSGQVAHLYYNDIRRFGWIKVIKTYDVKNLPFFKEMGPEPFVGQASSGQAQLTLKKFKEIISKVNSSIKVVIMDQKKIGGIGNIYANDALFDAKIDPRKKAKDLNDQETKRLYESILKVLKKGIDYGGASETNFVNALGQDGRYQNHFLVYGREGEKCFGCRGKIKKIKLGGRGTYFCPVCQS